jgi:hypothetical protein
MAFGSGFGQLGGIDALMFKILDTTGTPTITEVFPAHMAANIAITDTAQGVYDVVVKNMKGPRGLTKIFATAYVISNFASVTARSYSGNDLSVTVKVEDDASAAQDSSVDVMILAY